MPKRRVCASHVSKSEKKVQTKLNLLWKDINLKFDIVDK